MENSNYLAVDLGATSGRTVLATFDGQKIEMRELTRFRNPMIPMDGHLFWDIAGLYNEILLGLRKVADEGIHLDSTGIDTWGCDFAYFGKDGIKAVITLPAGVEGTFVWNGKEQILKSGENSISL